MIATTVWLETYVERHVRLSADVAHGRVLDIECPLFRALLSDFADIPELRDTPYLADVSWAAGAFDLLFTDGHGRWCAVEVKRDLSLGDRVGRARQNRRTHRNEKRNVLENQAADALAACQRRHPEGKVTALAILYDEGRWIVVRAFGNVSPFV